MEIKCFHISLFPSGHKDGGGQVLGRIARDDGHQAVQIEAAGHEDGDEDSQDGAQGILLFHRFCF